MFRARIMVVLFLVIIFAGVGTPVEAHQRWGKAPEVIIKSQACGGALPPCYVMQRESASKAYPNGGDPHIWNGGCYNGPCRRGSSTASGKWQFIRGTWDGFMGYRNAADAPPYIQNQKARLLWNNGQGCSNWSAC